jgi:Glycosyl hydrolase family 79 C-terminal beta domain
MRWLCKTVIALVILGAISLNAEPARQLSRDGDFLAVVRIHSEQGVSVPSNFMGLSHEWANSMAILGYSKTGTNLIYQQLLKNLSSFGSEPIELRIGGNSTDNNGKPSGDRMKAFAELASALHTPFILGINLGLNNLDISQSQVQFYLSEMPKGSIEAFELGNEPDHYSKRKMRPDPYAVADYLQDYDKWKTALLPMFPKGVLLAAPSWSATDLISNSSNITSFLDREAESVGVVSLHLYAGSPYANPPADYLLKPRSSAFGAQLFAPTIAAAHSKRIPFRITELNSYYGVGVHGQSDSFVAALWAIDSMFEYVKAGIDGVNWEADGINFCSPFVFTRTGSGQSYTFSVKTLTPLYYGLYFFQAATGNKSKLLAADVNTRANVKVWATTDSGGKVRVAILNKDESATGKVVVQMDGYREATVGRLLAPSYTSLNGVTFSGQTLDGTTDGMFVGTQKTETIKANEGQFEIEMPVTSAVLLTFRK